MKNLYYRPNPSFGPRHKPSSNKPPQSPKFLKYLFILLSVYFIFTFFGSSDSSPVVNDDAETLFLSKIDGSIRVLDDNKNSIDSVQVPFEIKPGYSVLTSVDSSAILNFSTDLKLRLSPSSKLEFTGSEDVLDFALDSGQIWVSNDFSPIDSPSVSITSNYLKVDSNSASYNLKSNLPESISVLSGNLLVSILDDASGSPLDQIKLDLGKQLTLDNDSYQKFKNRQVASVISTLQSELIQSSWYKWNVAMDSNNLYEPFSSFDRSFIASQTPISEIEDVDILSDDESPEDSQVVLDPALQPVVLTPSNEGVLTEEIIILEGSVPPDTQQVMVISYDEAEPVPYILKEFKPESGKFKYYASYDPGRGNIVIGKNKFDIVAIFSDGTESPKTTFEFEFGKEKPVAVTPVQTSPEPEVSTNPVTVTSSEVVASDQIYIKSINGLNFENNFVLTTDRGFLQGNVDKSIVSVFVNGFKLTRFKPNSGSFHYIMSPSFNTLKPGDNSVTAYGVYADGSKTDVLKLNIVYRP